MSAAELLLIAEETPRIPALDREAIRKAAEELDRLERLVYSQARDIDELIQRCAAQSDRLAELVKVPVAPPGIYGEFILVRFNHKPALPSWARFEL